MALSCIITQKMKDVYKRQDLCNMLKLQLEDKFNIYMANDGVEGPVSYTHLDVYKRQVQESRLPNR